MCCCCESTPVPSQPSWKHTHRSGVHTTPGSHVWFMREAKNDFKKKEKSSIAVMHSLTFPWNSVCVTSLLCQSVCLSVCRSVFLLLTCTSRHSALCFRLSMSTLHSCVDLICDVGFSLSPACLFFSFFFCSPSFCIVSLHIQQHNRRRRRRRNVVKATNLQQGKFINTFLLISFTPLFVL